MMEDALKENDLDKGIHDEQRTLDPPAKRGYLTFLRVFGGIQLIIGIIATLVSAFALMSFFERYGASPVFLLTSVAVALEGFLAYGLLNAVADIAENLILVGWFVKKTDSKR